MEAVLEVLSGTGWPGTESNRRHKDFQSSALPTELPGLDFFADFRFQIPENTTLTYFYPTGNYRVFPQNLKGPFVFSERLSADIPRREYEGGDPAGPFAENPEKLKTFCANETSQRGRAFGQEKNNNQHPKGTR